MAFDDDPDKVVAVYSDIQASRNNFVTFQQLPQIRQKMDDKIFVNFVAFYYDEGKSNMYFTYKDLGRVPIDRDYKSLNVFSQNVR